MGEEHIPPEEAVFCPSGSIHCIACLATDYLTEVSTLSGRGDLCIPYLHHYSAAFAFSVIL